MHSVTFSVVCRLFPSRVPGLFVVVFCCCCRHSSLGTDARHLLSQSLKIIFKNNLSDFIL